MVAIIDYGVGNLFSLKSSLEFLGQSAVITRDKATIENSDRVILPGVGAFGDAAEKLRAGGMSELVINQARSGKPLLGICLGMQLLFDKSYEYGEHPGLGLVPGDVRPLRDITAPGLSIPHIGWNSLSFPKRSELFKYINEGDFVYFVHSFYGANCDDYVTAYTEYSVPVTAAVERDGVFGTQFHPEKSGNTGLKILKAFCEVRA